MLISTIFKKRKVALAMILASIVALAFAPRYFEAYFMVRLITILVYVILTLSWSLFSGPTNYVSLATAALYGVGVYTSAVLAREFPLLVVVILGALVSCVLAFLIGLLTLRLRGIYFILFTFGVTALIRNVVLWWEAHITQTVGRHVPSQNVVTIYTYLLVIYAVTLLFSFLLRHSATGMALQSIGENEDAARHVGIDVTRLKIVVFSISALFMGATGAIMATRLSYVDPRTAFDPLISFLPVLMAIFGGTSRQAGPVLGATIFTVLQEFLITKYPYVYMLIMGLTLIGVIMYVPGGVVVQVDIWWIKIKIWRAVNWFRLKMWWREYRGID